MIRKWQNHESIILHTDKLLNVGDKILQRQFISLTKQVEFYSKVHEQLTQEIGASALQKHLSKSIFLVVIGSNDIFRYYFGSKESQNKSTPLQFANSMSSSLKVLLQVNVMDMFDKQKNLVTKICYEKNIFFFLLFFCLEMEYFYKIL